MAEILCSVVIPVYNEELVVAETYHRLKSVMDSQGVPYELIFVNDGSRDGSADILAGICESDRNVKVIEFSRNFGHQMAITAGMDYSCGKTTVIIDADLQDPPELIPKMLEKWQEGYDVVYGIRSRRKGETLFKKVTSKLYYRLIKRIADVDIPLDTGDFRLVDRKVCDALKRVNEKSRYVRGLISWLGFKQTGIEYTRDRRFAGETKYPLKKMLKFACDGIVSFSYKPLKLATWFGYAITTVCIVYVLTALIIGTSLGDGSHGDGSHISTPGDGSANIAASSISTPGQPLDAQAPLVPAVFQTAAAPSGFNPFLALCLLANGILLISTGIVGAYIGRIYDEIKARPLYIVRETKNVDVPPEAPLESRRAIYCREQAKGS